MDGIQNLHRQEDNNLAELTTILDSGDIKTLQLGPSTQAHKAGQIFYDDDTKTVSIHNEIPGVTLNVGQETYIPVHNATGATILNGSALKYGSTVTNGVINVELAIANSLSNARVIGVATHDMPDGTDGVITIIGSIGADTSAYSTADRLYLSDTVPGGYTTTAPDIVTIVGGTLNSLDEPSGGRMLISITNNVTTPTSLSFLQGQTTPTYVDMGGGISITNYVVSEDYIMESNATTGAIDTKFAGAYRFTFNWSGNLVEEKTTAYFELYNNTTASVVYTAALAIPEKLPGDSYSLSFSVPIKVVNDNEVFIMRARCDKANQDLTTVDVSFDCESIRIAL